MKPPDPVTVPPQAAVTTPSNPGPLLAAGRVVGRYELLEMIGKGGMGSVFVARDTTLDRKVALKLLPATSQMLNEARALARISHPNVVAIYDVGEQVGPAGEQQAWMAMELLEGEAADLWLRANRPWREVVQLFLRCGAGLQAVHERGLVHGDFKLSNVMVRSDGRVQLIDFGIARTSAPRVKGEPLAQIVSGTPGYMSPEQLEGRSLDARSDQFSFCCALWEAVYGTLPFGAGADDAHFDRIMKGPPGSASAKGVPRRLAVALAKGLSARPALRYQSMTALLRALRRAVPPSRRGWVALAAASALAGASVAVVWVASPGDCGSQRQQLLDTWSSGLRARVLAAQTPALVKRLDGHVAALARTSERVCVDFARNRKSPAELVDERTCLNHRTGEYLDVVEALAQGGPAAAADGLLAAEACDPATRGEPLIDFERLSPCRTTLAEMAAAMSDGSWAHGLSLLPTAQACAKGSEAPVLQSTALRYEGLLHERMGDFAGAEGLLHRAATVAVEGADESRAPAWSAVARLIGVRQRGRQLEAERWLSYAQAAARAGEPRRELSQGLALLQLQLDVIAGRPITDDPQLDELPAARAWRAVDDSERAVEVISPLLEAADDVDTLMGVGEAVRALPRARATALLPALTRASERLLPHGENVLARLWFARLARQLGDLESARAVVDAVEAAKPTGVELAVLHAEQLALASAGGEPERARQLSGVLAQETADPSLQWLRPIAR